jgi:hypothetical protein
MTQVMLRAQASVNKSNHAWIQVMILVPNPIDFITLIEVSLEEPLDEDAINLLHLRTLEGVVVTSAVLAWDIQGRKTVPLQHEVHHEPAHPAIPVSERVDSHESQVSGCGKFDGVKRELVSVVPTKELPQQWLNFNWARTHEPAP